ncbi:PAS domain-containing sensor histidine kinase [Rhizobium tubonense]|uniref:histidine kinase n=1 Tax=Rhizobium tubonense TaxID=484088 RepID=A0A2W4CQP7_9HYPH|nr:PAS domain-containing sensor histidine kinase [Rhizobium tubonense]PZM14922.1 PAS domain-containing sensor histidine kinase [Rhizobium tubonense]
MTIPSGLQEDFENLFENTVAGNLILTPGGVILRANERLAGWLDRSPADMTGRRLLEFLTIGGRIYQETHLAPMLRMQGEFEEVMLEMVTADGAKLPVLINAIEQRSADGNPLFIRMTVLRASARIAYEQNLRRERAQIREALATAEEFLIDEREAASLREQFIAVLGHDLRNPLAAVDAAMRSIGRSALDDRQKQIVTLAQASIRRMAGLIDDIMDFARGRLGGGIAVDIRETDLGAVLLQVVDELSHANPFRAIDTDLDLSVPVRCDGPKIAQLASNLLANAITHGSPETPITVRARSSPDGFEVAVTNSGPAIPAENLDRLFRPFTRSESSSKQGLGLGLYIASEIAKAHGGKIEVSSTADATTFTFRA